MKQIREWVVPLSALVLIIATWYYPLVGSLLKSSVAQVSSKESSTESVRAAITQPRLRYNRLGIEAPVHVLANTDPLAMSDWDKIRESLKGGVALTHLGDAFVTAPSAFIIGHSTDTTPHFYASVFAPLSLAKVGEEIDLELEGNEYLYKVTNVQVLTPTDSETFESLLHPIDGHQRIHLVTCWPLFTTKNRLVVSAERVLP